ncbi:MAG: arylsulfatase, partial [Candidatus Saccharimonadales bacterium]
MLASLAVLVNQRLPDGAGLDSQNVMPALLGQSPRGREMLVEQAGGRLAIRKGTWKYIPPGGPGPKAGQQPKTKSAAVGELYNLADDLGESRNRAAEQPERAAQLRDELAKIRRDP